MSNLLVSPPTVFSYTVWLRSLGFNTVVLPDGDPGIALTLAVAISICSTQLGAIDGDIYSLAVLNLATDRLINWQQDQTGQTFFKDLRADYKINTFVAGVVSAASDEATSTTLATPESLKHLTLMDLNNLQTPYGRTYLQFAQSLGSLWGLT